jgi:hypothetical protein
VAARISIKRNERADFFGKTGSGKTTLARALLNSTDLRHVVLDPKWRYTDGETKIVHSFRPKLERQIVRIPPGVNDLEHWNETIFEIWDRGDCILYIDEVTLLLPGTRSVLPWHRRAIVTGRERGLAVWNGTQRPTEIGSSVIFTEAEHFFVFRLQFEADRDKVCSFTTELDTVVMDWLRIGLSAAGVILLSSSFSCACTCRGCRRLSRRSNPEGSERLTFIGQARKRNQILGSIPNDQGANTPRRLDLRNAGYLDRLRLMQAYDFQFATANPTAADAFAQAGGQIARITLQSNSVGMLYDCHGEMAKVISAIDDAQRIGSANLDPAPNVHGGAGARATTNVWAADVPIAVHFNNKPWPIGCTRWRSTRSKCRLSAVPAAVRDGGDAGLRALRAGGTTTIATNVAATCRCSRSTSTRSRPGVAADARVHPPVARVPGPDHRRRRHGHSAAAVEPLHAVFYWLVLAGARRRDGADEAAAALRRQLRAVRGERRAQFANTLAITSDRGGQVAHRMNRMYDEHVRRATARRLRRRVRARLLHGGRQRAGLHQLGGDDGSPRDADDARAARTRTRRTSRSRLSS